MLPFNCVTYAKEIENELENFERMYSYDFITYGIDFNPLRWATKNFTQTAIEFHKRLESSDKSK